jgi:hypothetical protein
VKIHFVPTGPALNSRTILFKAIINTQWIQGWHNGDEKIKLVNIFAPDMISKSISMRVISSWIFEVAKDRCSKY